MSSYAKNASKWWRHHVSRSHSYCVIDNRIVRSWHVAIHSTPPVKLYQLICPSVCINDVTSQCIRMYGQPPIDVISISYMARGVIILSCWIHCRKRNKQTNKKTRIYTFPIISLHPLVVELFRHGIRGPFVLYNQCHGCWWPGDTRSQGISSHGIDYFFRNIPVSAPESTKANK